MGPAPTGAKSGAWDAWIELGKLGVSEFRWAFRPQKAPRATKNEAAGARNAAFFFLFFARTPFPGPALVEMGG